MKCTDLTPEKEMAIAIEVCNLHPHKALIASWRPRFFVIRKGWGSLRRRLEKADKEALKDGNVY